MSEIEFNLGLNEKNRERLENAATIMDVSVELFIKYAVLNQIEEVDRRIEDLSTDGPVYNRRVGDKGYTPDNY